MIAHFFLFDLEMSLIFNAKLWKMKRKKNFFQKEVKWYKRRIGKKVLLAANKRTHTVFSSVLKAKRDLGVCLRCHMCIEFTFSPFGVLKKAVKRNERTSRQD